MKRIDVDDKAFARFEKFRDNEDKSKVLTDLVKLGARSRSDDTDRIGLVMLEDNWFGFDENPGQASNAPFLEGLCRIVDRLKIYRLNFYDTNSFECALKKATTVPEKRILLYIGAHGSKAKVAAAHSANLMKKVRDFSLKERKIEGIILSSCSAAGHDPAIINSLEGGTNWIFGYTSNVDFLGSIQLETAILMAIQDAEHTYTDAEDTIVETFSSALSCFNPDWKIGETPRLALWESIRLVTRAKHKKNPMDLTADLLAKAWPKHAFP